MSKKQALDESILSPIEKQAKKVMSFVQYNKPKKPIEWSFVFAGVVLYYLLATFKYNREVSPFYFLIIGLVGIIVALHWFSYMNRTKTWTKLKEELSKISRGLVDEGKILNETELKDLFIENVNKVNKRKAK